MRAIVFASVIAGCSSASTPEQAPAAPPPPPAADPAPVATEPAPTPPFEPELATTTPTFECIVHSTTPVTSTFTRLRYYASLRKLASESSTSLAFSGAIIDVTTYDVAGRVTRRAQKNPYLVTATNYAYDDHGKLIRMYSDSGTLAAYRNGYDEAGRHVWHERDTGEWRMTYAYYPDGRLATESYDDSRDGSVESLRTHFYDSSGRRIRTQWNATWTPAGHSVETQTHLTYEGGRVVRVERDGGGGINAESADGRPDFTQTWTFAGDVLVESYASIDTISDVVMGPTTTVYEPACAPLLKQLPSIAGLPE